MNVKHSRPGETLPGPGDSGRSYECPPATIFRILTFKTIQRQTCQGQNLRQNKVVFVGMGGYDSSEYAMVLFFMSSMVE